MLDAPACASASRNAVEHSRLANRPLQKDFPGYSWVCFKIEPPGTAGFSPCFHLTGLHFGYLLLTTTPYHTHLFLSPFQSNVGVGEPGVDSSQPAGRERPHRGVRDAQCREPRAGLAARGFALCYAGFHRKPTKRSAPPFPHPCMVRSKGSPVP